MNIERVILNLQAKVASLPPDVERTENIAHFLLASLNYAESGDTEAYEAFESAVMFICPRMPARDYELHEAFQSILLASSSSLIGDNTSCDSFLKEAQSHLLRI